MIMHIALCREVHTSWQEPGVQLDRLCTWYASVSPSVKKWKLKITDAQGLGEN